MSGVGVLDTSLIAAVLAEPGRVAGLDAAAWSVLIGQARNAEMLGQLHARLSCAAALHFAPQAARRHLDLAWQLSMRHREAVRWEVLHIARALRKLDVPVVLLKGAAYALADYPAAEGRVFLAIGREALGIRLDHRPRRAHGGHGLLIPAHALHSKSHVIPGPGKIGVHSNCRLKTA